MMLKAVFVIVLLQGLCSARIITDNGVPYLVYNEFAYDGFYNTWNATGERFYEAPSSNAVCKNFEEMYGPTGSCTNENWRCREFLNAALPSDFVVQTRTSSLFPQYSQYTLSLNATPMYFNFYPQEQLHWNLLFQSGGFGASLKQNTPDSKLCLETIGVKPNRRFVISWVNLDAGNRPAHTTQIRIFETTNVLEFILHKWSNTNRPTLGFDGNYVLYSGLDGDQSGGNFDGFAAVYSPAACPTNTAFPAMQCVSSTRFQMCSNGKWAMPQSCQPGTFCNPDGSSIFCGFTNPLGTSTSSSSASATSTSTSSSTSTSTTAAVTSNRLTTRPLTTAATPQTTRALTTNNVVGPALVIETPAKYLVSLSTSGSRDYWIDTHSYNFGQVDTKTISWGPQYGKQVVKRDGQYDDAVDPTVTHVWTELTSNDNSTNFFPSLDQFPDPVYSWSGGNGYGRWRSEAIFFGSDFVLLGTNLKVWDSQGNLRGEGGLDNLNILFDWPASYSWLPQLDTFVPIDYTGSPINSRVRFEFTARRVNNPSITSGGSPATTNGLTTSPQPVTTKALTTASASTSCTVGATRCAGAAYQTCVYTWGSGGWVGGWGSNQNCAPGTSCVQYGSGLNTYISCS